MKLINLNISEPVIATLVSVTGGTAVIKFAIAELSTTIDGDPAELAAFVGKKVLIKQAADGTHTLEEVKVVGNKPRSSGSTTRQVETFN